MTPPHEPKETSIADAVVTRVARRPTPPQHKPPGTSASGGAPLGLAERAVRFLAVAGQLALVLLVVYLYAVEDNRLFFPLMCLVCGGFIIHAWLPARWRLGFFCLLSLLGLTLFLDWPDAAWLVGIGAGLIALCHLPVPRLLRAVLLIAAGVQLAAFRVEFPLPFWPVLASMFMFRLMLYLYEMYPGSPRPSLGQTVAYFFPLPNICFPLFPVIDFRTFRATYQSGTDYNVYQSGVAWIVRGLMHLLAYRFIKYNLLPAPYALRDVDDFALFLAANYALYLRVSGWFHIITGILHLFGFNLPRTHDNYFLASSFSDIWRRINIYWKNFMTQLFFFPAAFALRRLGPRTSMMLATLWVFLWTWLLHSYQAFWLLGELPLTWNDAYLWLTFGILAAINLPFDLKKMGQPSQDRPGLTAAVVLSLRVVGMFVLISIFWAVWTVSGFGLFLPLLMKGATVAGWLRVGGALLVAVLLGTVVQLLWRQLAGRGVLPAPLSWPGSVAVHTAVLAALVVLTLPVVGNVLGAEANDMIAAMRKDVPTVAEAEQALRGYYEELAQVPTMQAGPLLGQFRSREQRPTVPDYSRLSRVPEDPLDRAFLEHELIPGWSGEIVGSRLTINRFGMRDRHDLTREKPAGTYRIALVGSSVVMGYGVGDDEMFGRLLEKELNANAAAGAARIEVLNFGAGKHYSIHRRYLIDRQVLAFAPDVICYVAHQDEWIVYQHLARLVARRQKLPYQCLDEVVRQAGVGPDDPPGLILGQLERFTSSIFAGIYQDLAEECRRRKITPVWVYMPITIDLPRGMRRDAQVLIDAARAAGFAVIDLSGWEGSQAGEVMVDKVHPNALGHRKIAERLLGEMRARPKLVPGQR